MSAADQTRAQIAVLEENARRLLEKYDGFLPPLGYVMPMKSVPERLQTM
jgi:hypothetical protein